MLHIYKSPMRLAKLCARRRDNVFVPRQHKQKEKTHYCERRVRVIDDLEMKINSSWHDSRNVFRENLYIYIV